LDYTFKFSIPEVRIRNAQAQGIITRCACQRTNRRIYRNTQYTSSNASNGAKSPLPPHNAFGIRFHPSQLIRMTLSSVSRLPDNFLLLSSILTSNLRISVRNTSAVYYRKRRHIYIMNALLTLDPIITPSKSNSYLDCL